MREAHAVAMARPAAAESNPAGFQRYNEEIAIHVPARSLPLSDDAADAVDALGPKYSAGFVELIVAQW